MVLNIELDKKELQRLDEGGVIVMILPPGIRVIVKKEKGRKIIDQGKEGI